jgi:ligand-binding sensor domain-containing protein
MGLYCYDTTRIAMFQEEQGLPANHVYCLAEDSTGALLAGTQNGLVRYDGVVFCPLEGKGELTGRLLVHIGRNTS